jgi:coproporphyrinogen III oxidase
MSLPPNVQWVYDHHPNLKKKKKVSQSIEEPIEWIVD